MEVKEVEIDKLTFAEYNPRAMTKEEDAELGASLDTFGMVEPIVVNSAETRMNVIIGGHQRARKWKEMGNLTIPVAYINIPDLEKERELNLRLNKNLGHWDWDKLANFERAILEKVGFSKFELSEIFDLLISKEQATAEAEVNEKQMILTFPDCDQMDLAEKVLREYLDKQKINYRVSC